jgi:RNA polymerase sigma-70 factor (ECF subfamily)
VAQEAFVAAHRHLTDFREDASFKTWLLSITWRKALTRRRSAKAFLRRFVQPPPDTEWQVPDAGRTQEQAVLDRELHGHVRREIARLPPKLRDALLLASAGDHGYGDIAGMLGIPVGTLKWRVSEARRQLKARLAEVGYGHV